MANIKQCKKNVKFMRKQSLNEFSAFQALKESCLMWINASWICEFSGGFEDLGLPTTDYTIHSNTLTHQHVIQGMFFIDKIIFEII